MGLWARGLELFFDLFSPPACAACDAERSSPQPFCASCAAAGSITPVRWQAGALFAAAGAYEPPLSTAIVRFKYQGRAELAAPLSRLLLPVLQGLALPRDTLLVPVPLHAKRLASRGYNQAGLLASELAALAGHRARPRLLARTRHTERQVGKQRAERLRNLDAAFQIRGPISTAHSVVLIDDVITTGSTVRACAQALADANVQVVAILALARAHAD